jgi:hypothetical protein
VCFFNSGKPYNVLSKVTIYKSDGMGRDQYIVKDCGGFYKGGSNYSNGFRTSLRNYDVKPTKVLPNDFSLLSKNLSTQQSSLSLYWFLFVYSDYLRLL